MAVNGQKRLLSGVHAVLHPQSERQLSGWTAYREVTPAPCAYAFTGSDATDTALALQEQAEHLNQMLRGHYAYYGIAGNIRALRKVHRAVERYWHKNAEQPELERRGLVEAIPADQGTVPTAATQAASPLWGAAGSSHTAVNQLLKSVVR